MQNHEQLLLITFGICVSDVVEIGWVKVKYALAEEIVDDVDIEAKLVVGTWRRPEWSSGIRQQLPIKKCYCL